MRTVTTVAPPLAKPEWFASWFDSAHYHQLYARRDQAVDELAGFRLVAM